MPKTLIALVLSLLALGPAVSAGDFDDDFTGATMRLDLFHTGSATTEIVTLDRVRVEGPWPGSRTQLLDRSNLGKYFVEVVDLESQAIIYSRGFASIYGEWETTGEAVAGEMQTIAEAIRVPEPRRPVQVRLRKRGGNQSFSEIWQITVDPSSRHVHRAAVPEHEVWSVFQNGESAVKVDLLILGDGYTAGEMDKYRADVQRMTGHLFDHEPFASRKSDFNVWAVDAPAPESGISRPRSGMFRETPLGASYNSLDSERYVLTLNDRAWRDVAAAAPYDSVIILVNSEKYGGGGIYGLYATAAVDSGFAPYLMVHEFGHSFAGLGDEYFTSDVAYEDFQGGQTEPWEPNITALNDPETLKWRDLVAETTPLPTPWEKKSYEAASREIQGRRRELRKAGASEKEVEKLFIEEQKEMTARLGGEKYAGEVGAFEGASYQAQGLYRPSVDCLMFTRDEVGFCDVCGRAIERVIDLYAK